MNRSTARGAVANAGLQTASDRQLENLRTSWRSFLESLDKPTAHAGLSLGLKIGIQQGVVIRGWIDHFSSLTLFYPNLQTEGDSIDENLRHEADLAQLCFLVSTFCEDRVADGQIQLTHAEASYVRAVRNRGWRTLETLASERPPICDWIERLTRDFELGSQRAYTGAAPARYGYASIRKVAPARGYPGLRVPLAMAARAGADVARLRAIKTAFDRLMLGLQWLDDLVDWREDLATGDINLLLDMLRVRGLDAREHPADSIRETNVGFALVTHGILDTAALHSIRWLRSAAKCQRVLRCMTLADLIESRIGLVRQRLERARTEVMRAVFIDPGTAEAQRVCAATPLGAGRAEEPTC
jgi:hypothetical protein